MLLALMVLVVLLVGVEVAKGGTWQVTFVELTDRARTYTLGYCTNPTPAPDPVAAPSSVPNPVPDPDTGPPKTHNNIDRLLV